MAQQILARSLATMVIIRFSPCVNVSCPLVQSSLAEEACLPLYGLLWHDLCSPTAITRKTCLFSSDSSKLLFWNLSGKVSRSILTTQITRRLPGSVLRDNVATLICCLFSVK